MQVKNIQKLKSPRWGCLKLWYWYPKCDWWLTMIYCLFKVAISGVWYAPVPETQEHHSGYCIIYIYILYIYIYYIIYIYIHAYQNSLSRLPSPSQSHEIPTAVKSDEMPALGQLRLWFLCCRRYCQWRRCWMCPCWTLTPTWSYKTRRTWPKKLGRIACP